MADPCPQQPFITALIQAGNLKLAATFIPKASNLLVPRKVELYVKCGMVTRAAEEAFKAKDVKSLQDLREKATGTAAGDIDRMIAQLRPSK
jgi:hypothetical protein